MDNLQMNFRYDENHNVVMDKSEQEYARKATELEQQKNAQRDSMTYKQQRELQKNLLENKIGELDKNHKWYNSTDSENMTAVKNSMRAVVAKLNQPLPLNEDGEINDELFKAQKDELLAVYNEAIANCERYIKEAPAKWSTGKLRKSMVRGLLNFIRDEKDLLDVVTDNVGAKIIVDMEECHVMADLYSHIKTEELADGTEAEWQQEGNSTDVYKVNTRSGKVYYVKENMRLIGDDLDGFVDRRIRQLDVSREAKLAGNAHNIETRLVGITEKDYNDALAILRKMKTTLTEGSGSSQAGYRERYINFLGHDFVKIFNDLKAINKTIEGAGADKAVIQAALDEQLEAQNRASDNDKPKFDALISAYRKQLASEELQPLTPIAYIKQLISENKLGLDANKDKALIRMLSDMNLEAFFTRTLGKEVELYGQQKERGNVGKNDVTAKNNTATGRIADFEGGFTDVVTTSNMSVLKFKRKGEETASDVCCTMITEAPGDEMLQVIKRAEDTGKTVEYSKNAVRQLIRLQMYDTVCLQTDRHWRNFKVTTSEEGNKIIINSLKSYDHDMSFGLDNLDNAFRNGKAGMLPPLTKKVKVGSFEHSILVKENYIDIGAAFLKNPPVPKATGKYTTIERYLSPNVFKSKSGFFGPYLADCGWSYYKAFANVLRDKDGKELAPDDKFADPANVTVLERADEQTNVISRRRFVIKSVEDPEDGDGVEELTAESEVRANGLRDVLYEIQEIAILKNVDKGRKFSTGYINLDLPKEKIGRLLYLLKQLREIYDGYSFADTEEGAIAKYLTECVLNYFSTVFVNDKEAFAAFKEYEAANGIANEEEEIEVPTLLHMDAEAFRAIKLMKEHFDECVVAKVADLNWSQEKIDAYRARINDYVDKIENVVKPAAEGYLARKYGAESPKAKFFLEEDDYAKFDDIKELAWDPGMSYFATEDPSFLFGQDAYKDMASAGELTTAKGVSNSLRQGERQKLTVIADDAPLKSMVGSKIN